MTTPTGEDDPYDASNRRPGVLLETERQVFARRAGAAIVDALVTAALAFGLLLVVALGVVLTPGIESGDVQNWIWWPVWGIAALEYHAILEWQYGATPGKRLFGLAVADADGEPISGRTAIVRNLLRPIDALVFYAIGSVTMFLTRQSQRLGDLVAGTVVGKRE